MIPLRLYLYAAAALAIAGLLWGAVHVWNKAARVDIAEAALTDYKAAVAARDKKTVERIASAEKRSADLASTLNGTRTELEDLRAHPVTSVVYREKKINGVTCPDPRIGPDWLRVYNAASDASTVHPPT